MSQLPFHLARFLQEVSKDRVDRSALLFEFFQGDEFNGFIELEVRGTGQTRLKANLTSDRVLFWRSGRLTKGEVGSLFKSLSKNRVWSLRTHAGRGPTDEAEVRLRVRYLNHHWSGVYLLDDVSRNARYQLIHAVLSRLIGRLSGDKVLT